MLEVNDFNAIRISLASPEQIRGWSYGEVTKPETINYRTLKPEKDGLFCERIFGPQKDWECYCGKYKRVRYKGIICDKCGVEVARAKVRRERMGHIELASPVSHIWYFKGTPSRLGLLLDVSPRNLERILYFALYIVTSVDEEGKRRAIERVREEEAARTTEIEGGIGSRGAELIAAMQEGDIQRAQELGELEQRRTDAINDVMASGLELDAAKARVDELEAQFGDERSSLQARHAEEQENQQRAADAEMAQSRTGQDDQIDQVRQQAQKRIEEIESLKFMTLLNETQYRDLKEQYGYLFEAGMGAEAIRDIILQCDLDQLAVELRNEIRSSSQSSQRRKKATKRLRVVEAFRKSDQRPEWMILTVLPVIPPDLRPMVQLDGGRFATSDLNDLYRRVINRNNRLKRLIELGAPEIIIRNEKRMLQEATDALIDNGRRGRAVNGSGNHKLKSLSDMLKGKQGRFRQNLLGKRVDYSGRSVIVVGPDLRLNQCGLPKKMALELFKPFVMRKLVERGFAHNIKSAKRIVERVRPEVWDVLEEVIRDHPVLLNRAPTLHRLGIQAFDAVLVEGSAIQIHPLVCTAFNADFDGDQMAVHVPLSKAAQNEARSKMMSSHNLLSPANGEPIVNPTKDMVLGCFYLTSVKEDDKGHGSVFSSFDEALQALELERISLHAPIFVGIPQHQLDQEIIETTAGRVSRSDLETLPNSSKAYGLKTTAGRIVFNEVLPETISFKNEVQDKGSLRDVVGEVYAEFGQDRTAHVADEIKRIGFHYATHSGITMSVADITIPQAKPAILRETEDRVLRIQEQYEEGLITDDERYREAVAAWTEASQEVEEAVTSSLDPNGPIYMMSVSGAAKGGFTQVRQIAGMRGLMADPSGKIIEMPITSNFREGLSVLEYFISTHGARKGLADTALRTAESGYLTRRLIDVAQDVIIREEDCGTAAGLTIQEKQRNDGMTEPAAKRAAGRWAAEPFYDPETGTLIVDGNQMIDQALSIEIGAVLSRHPDAFLVVRSPLTCTAKQGICRHCYGWSLATGHLVEMGEAVGIIAAQSIGEPGTQLTMRTFHTGGVAGSDITQGLPRVEELFEARVPKEVSVISEIDGVVRIERDESELKIVVASMEEEATERYALEAGYTKAVSSGELVRPGTVLARPGKRGRKQEPGEDIIAQTTGLVSERDGQILIAPEPLELRQYPVSLLARLRVSDGQFVTAGTQLTDGASNPQDILRVMGREAVQLFLVDEVQRVYRTQGVGINDKHIEVIVRQMLRKVRVDTPGDTEMLPGELVDRFKYETINAAVLAQGGEPATATTVLLGVTKASLSTDSFLAAASFQDTTKVLTDAAIGGHVDHLVGLKENVIIGKLIPAGTGLIARRQAREALLAAERAGLEMGDGNGDFAIEAVNGDVVDGNGTVDTIELDDEVDDFVLAGAAIDPLDED